MGQRKNDKAVGLYGEITQNNNGSRLMNICEKDMYKFTWVQTWKKYKIYHRLHNSQTKLK